MLAIHLRSLQSMKLVHLHRVQLLARIQLLLNQSHLACRELYQLTRVLELSQVNRLVHRTTGAVTRLEVALLTKVSHRCLLRLLLILLTGLWVVSPVALKVARATASVTTTTTTKIIAIGRSIVVGHGWELEGCTPTSASSSVVTNSYALTSTVCTTSSTSGRLLGNIVISDSQGCIDLIFPSSSVIISTGTGSTWDWKLKA